MVTHGSETVKRVPFEQRQYKHRGLDRSDEANDHFFPLTNSLGSGNMLTVRKIGQNAVRGEGG